MGLPAGLTLIDSDQTNMPEGLTLIEGDEEAESKELPIDLTENYEKMPNKYLEGQFHPTNAKLDKQFAEAAWKTEQTNLAAEAGELGLGSELFQKTVNPLRPAGIVAVHYTGEILSSLKKGIEFITPDFVKDMSEDLGSALYETDTNKQMTDFVKEGGASLLSEWSKLDKDTRKNIELTGILSMFIPAGKVASEAVKSASSLTRNVAGKLSVSLVKGLKAQKLSKAADFVTPPLRSEALKRLRDGKYKLTADGIIKRDIVSNLKGYKPNSSTLYNHNVVGKELDKLGLKLDLDIKKHGSKLDSVLVDRKIGDVAVKLTKMDSDFVGVSPKVGLIEIGKVREKIRLAVQANGGVLNSSVINNVRKELGKDINWKKNRDEMLPKDKLRSAMYDELNKIVDSSVKVNVSRSREKVHHLIDILGNASKKLDSGFDGTLKKAMTHVFDNVGKAARAAWVVKTLGKFTGAGTAAFAVGGKPLLITAGLTYGAGKVIMSRRFRSGVADVLSGLARAAKNTKDKAKLLEINGSKEAIIKLLANSVVSEDTREAEDVN